MKQNETKTSTQMSKLVTTLTCEGLSHYTDGNRVYNIMGNAYIVYDNIFRYFCQICNLKIISPIKTSTSITVATKQNTLSFIDDSLTIPLPSGSNKNIISPIINVVTILTIIFFQPVFLLNIIG